ncbi:MAG: DUF5856 family protein [Bacteroides sp.]|nr:DUF5856 family protein [Bacteroides sp.]
MMDTKMQVKKCGEDKVCSGIAVFFGKLYSFNSALKLYHWHVTGRGSYARHMALDQAVSSLSDTLDRLVETAYSLYGGIDIVIPETAVPVDIIEFATDFYNEVEYRRELFREKFIDSIIDDYQEAIQQLLYRLIRLE